MLPASGEKGKERLQNIYRRKTACPSAAELTENAGGMDRDIEKYRHSGFLCSISVILVDFYPSRKVKNGATNSANIAETRSGETQL